MARPRAATQPPTKNNEVESYDLLKQTWPAERVIVFLRNKRWEAELSGCFLTVSAPAMTFTRSFARKAFFETLEGRQDYP